MDTTKDHTVSPGVPDGVRRFIEDSAPHKAAEPDHSQDRRLAIATVSTFTLGWIACWALL